MGLLLISVTLSGQEKHSVSLTIGHAHVLNGRDAEGGSKMLSLPMWGLDYNYKISSHWQIGLHTDLVLETFEVEKNLEGDEEVEVVERSHPIAPAIMGIYKLNHHWGFGFGVGGEFAKEENYLLSRAAVEYGAEIRNGWEVFGVLQYDFRWNAYDTWTIGLGISKSLGKSSKAHHE
ncbi:hypothetical protein [Flavihumibacter fluvii]|uniref:hypothetical protein n=1 Tax=Flavihumibacter fluvii TaxID=2838157 RepID=UPI001BDF5C6A|nr:hypothetical protein [Flavihumibacter fluvii]ULQ52872.1 hypothetical protein KJS93_00895 [Flavihumibacter fluvii]